MRIGEMMSTNPISVERSVRGDEVRALTSGRAGKILPLSYIPMLREDRVSRGQIRISLDMAETVHSLMNSVNVTAYAHFIPFLAFDRFGGMESFNRSYQGQGEPHNDQPIPFFHTVAYDRESPFWKTLGVHWRDGEQINSAPLEAYNTLVNWRREARSQKLYLRGKWDEQLAAAFWKNPNLWHIVPDFEQAAMDGEVELQWSTSQLRVTGIGRTGPAFTPSYTDVEGTEWLAGKQNYEYGEDLNDPRYVMNTGTNGAPAIFAELEDAGVRVSLANIELAKQTAAFAKLRKQFSGLDEDHIVDLLMEGIRVPDEAMKQPILLDRKSTIFGYSERHAMDGASLDMSVTTGSTSLDLTSRTPAMNTGGIILVTCEIVPEQLHERMYDTFLGTTDPATLPNFLRDYLDPEKVDVVQNQFVDVEHDTPTGTFGYAPLNHAWKRSLTRIGGKYFRRNPDTFVEDRQKFWSVEQLNPSLTADFYLVNNLPHSVFLDTVSDPFEILSLGNVQVVGATVFGKTIEEDTQEYQSVADQVDRTRINQEEEPNA